LNGLVGPERLDESELRALGDAGHWEGLGLYARWAPREATGLALRAEYFADEAGGISATPQILKEVTATLEHRPAERLIVKLEGCYDRSTARVFEGGGRDAAGDPVLERDQFLVLLGLVADFPAR
jgi:hypothetical protein